MAIILVLAISLIAKASAATLTQTEKDAILAEHNRLRSTLPDVSGVSVPCTAANMQKLTWDATLATDAQTFADTCDFNHPTAELNSKGQGENLYTQFPGIDYTQTNLVTGGVTGWYNEMKDVDWSNALTNGIKSKTCTNCASECAQSVGSACEVGHFTQVVWAETNKVGCGIGACSSGVSGTGASSGVILVCRYSPRGNQNGATSQLATLASGHATPPYFYGTTCAACSGSCTDSLCTSTPTDCADKTNISPGNGATYATCAEASAAYTNCGSTDASCGFGQLNYCTNIDSQLHDCDAHCGVCTPVSTGMGSSFCGSSTSNSGTSNSGTSNSGTSDTSDNTTSDTDDTNGTSSTSDTTVTQRVASTSGASALFGMGATSTIILVTALHRMA